MKTNKKFILGYTIGVTLGTVIYCSVLIIIHNM